MQDLIMKYFNGDITVEEKKILFSRMETDPELKKEFASVQNLSALASWLPGDDDELEAVDNLTDFKQRRIQKRKRTLVNYYKPFMGYAAAICVAVLSTWSVMKRTELAESKAVSFEEFSTPAGQRAKVKLHDGTTVWLNARSSLRYPNHFSGNQRRVELDGEAFFEVTHNENTPFVVSTGKLDIRVLGTKFNVFAYKGRNEFNTSLVEGSVKICDSGNDSDLVVLEPNQSVELLNGQLVKRAFRNADFLLWKEGIYSFDDQPFHQIVKKLELYYDITIIVQNKKLADYRFSGKFRQRDGVESVLHTLQKVYNFSYVKDEDLNKIIIR